MRSLLAFLMGLTISTSFAGDRYFVAFADRTASPYSLERPEEFLSSRALERRARQGISLRQGDLPISPAYLDAVRSAGVDVRCRLKGMNGVVIEVNDSSALPMISQLPFVREMRLLHRDGQFTGQDKWESPLVQPVPGYGSARIASFDYGLASRQVSMITCDYLHDSAYDGRGMIIAVIDAGFNQVNTLAAFDSLRIHDGILGTWDFVDNEADVYGDHTHGMNVLSCIAANLPGEMVGTAPGASFFLLRSETTASESLDEEYYWAAAAEYADSAGADVISSSLGYTVFDDISQNHTYADMDGHTTVVAQAANHAASAGMLVVVSAGNNGASWWNFISTPADADSALAVGAVDAGGNYASFSSNGPAADGDVKPDVAAMGQGTYVYTPLGTVSPGNGTSFAAPLIAGAAACLWQAFDSLHCIELADIIRQSSSRYLHPDTLVGYGIPNFVSAFTMLQSTRRRQPLQEGIVEVYPVPWQQELNVILNVSVPGSARVRILDVTGRSVYDEEARLYDGMQNLQLQTPALGMGVYFLEIITADNRFVRTLMAGKKL